LLHLPDDCDSPDISKLVSRSKQKKLELSLPKSRFGPKTLTYLVNRDDDSEEASHSTNKPKSETESPLLHLSSFHNLPEEAETSSKRGLRKNVDNEQASASDGSSSDHSNKIPSKTNRNPFTKDFYERINQYLDSLGLEEVDPEEYFQDLDTLKRLKVSKHLSMIDEPTHRNFSGSLKVVKSESYAPVTTQNRVPSNLIQRRISSGKACEGKVSLSIHKVALKLSSGGLSMDYAGGSTIDEESSKVGSLVLSQEPCGPQSNDSSPGSPSPLDLKFKRKANAMSIPISLDDDASPQAPCLKPKKKYL